MKKILYRYQIKMANETWLQNGSENLQSMLEWLSDEQKKDLLEILSQQQWKKNYWELDPVFVWDFEKVLDDITHRMWIENIEQYWIKWKRVHINLPAVWDFEWLSCDFFVSNERYSTNCFSRFEHKVEYYGKFGDHKDEEYIGTSLMADGMNSCLYSVEEITNMLDKIDGYLSVYWVWSNGYSSENAKKVLSAIFEKATENSHAPFWLNDSIPGGKICWYNPYGFVYNRWKMRDDCHLLFKDKLWNNKYTSMYHLDRSRRWW